MNRKSGGIPSRLIPANFGKYLRYVNEIASFTNDQQIMNPTYFDLPESPSIFNPQVIIDTFSSPMKHLATVLRIISADFAMDILRSSSYFADKNDEFLKGLLRDPSVPIFKPELGDEGANCFLDCLRRYIGFESLYYLLDDLVFSWRHRKDETKLFFSDSENTSKSFNIKSRHNNWNESIYLSVKAVKSKKADKLEYFIDIKTNEWIEILQDLEIERVRRCKYCLKFFWADTVKKTKCCTDEKGDDSAIIQRIGLEKIRSNQARNLEIRKQVEAQPEFVSEPPTEKFIKKPIDLHLLNSLVLVDGEPYTVVEMRQNMVVLKAKPRLGMIRTIVKKIVRIIW